MKDTIQRQLDMIWRTENPNYLIIVKNKAGKNMNFTNFQIVQADVQPGDEKPNARFIISIDSVFRNNQDATSVGTIEVTEEGRIVFRTKTKQKNLKQWISKLKRDYRETAIYYEPK